ncbi:MAG: DUF58 domain-containing protein [Actinomycetota bacterium]
MPTQRGRALLVSSFVLYILSRLGSIGELYVLATACLVFPLVCVASVRWGKHSLRFDRTIGPRRVFAGHEVRVSVTVHNLASRRSPPIELDDEAPTVLSGSMRFPVPSLASSQQTTVVATRRANARGRYSIGPLRARLVDPFGLAAVTRSVGDPAVITVYPRVVVLHEQAPPQPRGGGGRSIMHHIASAGDEFYGVREWRDGDDLRKIHWRSTAKRGELMIRQDEVRPFPRATILIDNRSIEHVESRAGSSIEYAVSAAASIVWELGNQGFALRLATAEAGPSGARWGREAVDPLLSALATLERSPVRTFAPAIKRTGGHAGAGGALVALMTPPSTEMIPSLARLRSTYEWCGVILLDTASFLGGSPRQRAVADQRIAECDRSLTRAGWRVAVAGASDQIGSVWQALLASGTSRPSPPSLRS